jgi:hypothetical protein
MDEFPSLKARKLLTALKREPLAYTIARRKGSHRRLKSQNGYYDGGIRASRVLDDDERAYLLEYVRWIPRCKPQPIEIDDDLLRPINYEDVVADRWDSQTDGGIEYVCAVTEPPA